MKFSTKDSFSKYDQIHRKLRVWSHLLKKSFMENFIFCAVYRVNIRIQPKYGKWQARKSSEFGHFSHNAIFCSK